MSIARDSTFLLTSQIIGFVLGVLTSIVVSRELGPSLRGIYFLVHTINYMVVNFGNFGIDTTNVYLLTKKKRGLNEINSNSIISAVLIGAIFITVYSFCHDFLHQHLLKEINPIYTTIAICLVPLTLYNRYWGAMMGGLKKFELISKLRVIFSILVFILTFIVLFAFEWGISGLLGLWAINTSTTTLLYFYLVNKEEKIKITLDWKLFKEVAFFGFKGHIGNIGYYLFNRLDMFIVNYFVGTAGVGNYSLSVSLAEKTWFVPSPLMHAATPSISESKRDVSAKLTARVIRHTLLLASSVAILLLMIAPWSIPLLYGDEYSPAINPLLVLLPGTVFILISMILSSFITFQLGKPQICSLVAWINILLYIPLSIFVISRFGIVGAALTSTIIYFVLFSVFFFIFQKKSMLGWKEILFIKMEDLRDYGNLINRLLARLREVGKVVRSGLGIPTVK